MSRKTLIALCGLMLAACSVGTFCSSARADLFPCPSGSSYSLKYRYCTVFNPQYAKPRVEAVVRVAAIAYAKKHHWKTYCSKVRTQGYVCVLYVPDTTGHALTDKNYDVVANGRATTTIINGKPTVIWHHLSYTLVGGSGCAVTVYIGALHPATTDACGAAGLARVRKELADTARAFP